MRPEQCDPDISGQFLRDSQTQAIKKTIVSEGHGPPGEYSE